MLTVQILVNGEVVYARSARNTGTKTVKSAQDGTSIYKYKVDTGDIIEHERNEGILPLAHKILDTIDEIDEKK